MPKFEYHGRNAAGRAVKGQVEALNESTVAAELVRNGIVPVSIALQANKRPLAQTVIDYLSHSKPSTKDITFFCKQMSTLIKAGVPMIRSVKVVSEGSKNLTLKEALAKVLVSMESGQSFTACLKQHPDVFPTLMVSLVSVGESSGSLDEVFRQLSIHFSRDAKTSKQIKSALRYPTIIILVMFGAVWVVNVFVIPSFTKFFSKFHTDLPLPTQILIGVSNAFVDYWYMLIFCIVAIVVSFVRYTHSRSGRVHWDTIKLKMPIFGNIMRLALMARFCRGFALSVRTGVPLLDSIAMVAKTTDNVYVGNNILAMADYIKRGESLTVSATKVNMFTPLILQMLGIGEETGEVDKLLEQVSDAYEEEVDYAVETLGDAIEPILILFIAGMVLMLALGIFLPMWDMSKVVSK